MENIADESTDEDAENNGAVSKEKGAVEVEQEDASNSVGYDKDSLITGEDADDVAMIEMDDTPVEDLDDPQIVGPTKEPETDYDTQLAIVDSQETCELLLAHSPKAKPKKLWIRKTKF
jgi:hypothetical protein